MKVIRAISLKADIDTETFARLLSIASESAAFGNRTIRAMWAEAVGLKTSVDSADKHDIQKQVRRCEKGTLSSYVVDAIMRECSFLWKRYGKAALDGGALPQFSQGKALAVRDRGIAVTHNGKQYIVSLGLQSGQDWLNIPIAKGSVKDEYQAPVLQAMVDGGKEPLKAFVVLTRETRQVTIRLSVELDIPVREPGDRKAVLTIAGNRLLLRTDMQTHDCTPWLNMLLARKQDWELIRRSVVRRLGRGHVSARRKRKVLARLSWDDWLKTHLAQGASDWMRFLETQYVGELVLAPLTGNWPIFQLKQRLTETGLRLGIHVVDEVAASDD